MRIRIILELTNKSISVNYSSKIQGFLYHALPDSIGVQELHDEGIKSDENNKKYKLFSFSELYGSSIYDKGSKLLIFKSPAYFDVCAFDDALIEKIISYLELNKKILLGSQLIDVLNYEILTEKILNTDEITYTTESPIIVYTSSNGKYYYPDQNDELFYNLILNNLKRKLKICYGIEDEDIYFTITNVKRKIVFYRKMSYDAFHLQITFKNPSKYLQNVILKCGLGAKNSCGYGMMNAI